MFRLLVLLALLLCLTGVAPAKRVADVGKRFTVEVPDDWTLRSPQNVWANRDVSTCVSLNSKTEVNVSLEQWAKLITKRNAQVKISNDKLAGAPAKRIEFTTADGNLSCAWIAKRGNVGAVVTLIYSQKSKGIPELKKLLTSSYKWSS